jgi:hypothetical protein
MIDDLTKVQVAKQIPGQSADGGFGVRHIQYHIRLYRAGFQLDCNYSYFESVGEIRSGDWVQGLFAGRKRNRLGVLNLAFYAGYGAIGREELGETRVYSLRLAWDFIFYFRVGCEFLGGSV